MARANLVRRAPRADRPSLGCANDADDADAVGQSSTQQRGLPRGSAGQALVEFAFSIILLLLILGGTLDLGRAFFRYERLVNAAREGAFWRGYTGAGITEVANHVQAEAGYVLCDDGVLPTVTPLDPDDATEPTDPHFGLTGVRVQCIFRPVTPHIAAITGPNINLATEAWAPKIK